jgi:hypothetical protein
MLDTAKLAAFKESGITGSSEAVCFAKGWEAAIGCALENKLISRDQIARALCESFYAKGHIYDATTARVIEARWQEWRPQADDLLKRYAIFERSKID